MHEVDPGERLHNRDGGTLKNSILLLALSLEETSNHVQVSLHSPT
jgi:hypothetical protein